MRESGLLSPGENSARALAAVEMATGTFRSRTGDGQRPARSDDAGLSRLADRRLVIPRGRGAKAPGLAMAARYRGPQGSRAGNPAGRAGLLENNMLLGFDANHKCGVCGKLFSIPVPGLIADYKSDPDCGVCTAKRAEAKRDDRQFVPPFQRIGDGNEIRDSADSHVGYTNSAHVAVARLNAMVAAERADAARQAVAEWLAGLPQCPGPGTPDMAYRYWIRQVGPLVAAAQRGWPPPKPPVYTMGDQDRPGGSWPVYRNGKMTANLHSKEAAEEFVRGANAAEPPPKPTMPESVRRVIDSPFIIDRRDWDGRCAAVRACYAEVSDAK